MTNTSEQLQPMAEPTNGPRSIKGIIRDLSQPLAKRHLKTRRQGGAELTYIDWRGVGEFASRHNSKAGRVPC